MEYEGVVGVVCTVVGFVLGRRYTKRETDGIANGPWA
jgi:hypothetical protein